MTTLKDAHALVVGISNYQHINRLPLTVLKDAHELKALPESYYETLKTGRGRVILASSHSTEASMCFQAHRIAFFRSTCWPVYAAVSLLLAA